MGDGPGSSGVVEGVVLKGHGMKERSLGSYFGGNVNSGSSSAPQPRASAGCVRVPSVGKTQDTLQVHFGDMEVPIRRSKKRSLEKSQVPGTPKMTAARQTTLPLAGLHIKVKQAEVYAAEMQARDGVLGMCEGSEHSSLDGGWCAPYRPYDSLIQRGALPRTYTPGGCIVHSTCCWRMKFPSSSMMMR